MYVGAIEEAEAQAKKMANYRTHGLAPSV